MTLTKESEALLESAAYVCNELDWKCVPLAGLADRLAAIEAAVREQTIRDVVPSAVSLTEAYERGRAEQAAEVERLTTDNARLRTALEYQDDRVCVTFRAHQPPTCETHWSEWPIGAGSCEWRQAAHAALAATPVAPAPSQTTGRIYGEWHSDDCRGERVCCSCHLVSPAVSPPPNSAPNPTAPHRCRECDDGPNLSFPEPTHAPPAPGER